MKKIMFLIAIFAVVCVLGGCSENESNKTTENSQQESSTSEKVSGQTSTSESTTVHIPTEKGEAVKIVGQVAANSLVDGNTLWVQVLNENSRTIIYHCKMKDEYISEAEKLNILDVVKIRGSFLSKMDLEREDTAILVTLYDCEIIK